MLSALENAGSRCCSRAFRRPSGRSGSGSSSSGPAELSLPAVLKPLRSRSPTASGLKGVHGELPGLVRNRDLGAPDHRHRSRSLGSSATSQGFVTGSGLGRWVHVDPEAGLLQRAGGVESWLPSTRRRTPGLRGARRISTLSRASGVGGVVRADDPVVVAHVLPSARAAVRRARLRCTTAPARAELRRLGGASSCSRRRSVCQRPPDWPGPAAEGPCHGTA